MPAEHAAILALNAGEIGEEAIARIDLAKMRFAAEEQSNLLPRVLGPAIFRPGTEYLTPSRTTNGVDGRNIPFDKSVETRAVVELSSGWMRILLPGGILTRPSITAEVLNGTFVTDLSNWTDADEAGATSDFSSGMLRLLGTGTNYAIRRQQVTVNEPNVEHGLRILVAVGPVTFRVGSSSGADDYIRETELRSGGHSIAFTPTGNFHITVMSRAITYKFVSAIILEDGGVPVEITTPWSLTELRLLRYIRIEDVIFCACDGVLQQRIERRSDRSWSIVDYLPEDGPFRLQNLTSTTLDPSATTGNITIAASRNVFKTGHVGALFRLTHSGQTASATLGGADQFCDPIRVSGVDEGNTRHFFFTISGVWAGTITLQRSFAEPGSWEDVDNYTANGSHEFEDDFSNSIIFYRLGFKAGNYTSGSATVTMTFSGSQSGIVRITDFTSATAVSAEVITTLGQNTATSDWAEGEWSDERGYPSAVEFNDGRLLWGWNGRGFWSVSDAFESYDDETEGDAGPIIRYVGGGPVHWIMVLQRALFGMPMQEASARGSSLDEPITPTQYTARDASTRGSGNVQAVKVDSRGVFVQRNLKRIYALEFVSGAQDYSATDLTRLKPEMCAAGVVEMAVQRQPDTRIWVVLSDGTCAVLLFEPDEDQVAAWVPVTTDGAFRSVCVLPGADEDEVYFIVRRTINGVTKYYQEKLTTLGEVIGASLSKNMDCHKVISQASSTTITGLSHLEGKQVVVWAGGVPLVTADAPKTVSGGQITGLSSAVTSAVVGLSYTGRFKSAKLAYGAALGTPITFTKRVSSLSLLMKDVGWKGVRIGRDFSNLRGLNNTYKGRTLSATEVLSSYDYDATSFNGSWDTDSRVCFQIQSPYPATFLGMAMTIETSERRVPNDKG